jgi:hypothetical protein
MYESWRIFFRQGLVRPRLKKLSISALSAMRAKISTGRRRMLMTVLELGTDKREKAFGRLHNMAAVYNPKHKATHH